MATEAKHLESGQLSVSKAVIYTSPALTASRISKFVLTNITEEIETATFYRSDGDERLIGTYKIPATASGEGMPLAVSDLQGIILDAGDTILAKTTTASAVNFQIDGDEIT